MSSDPPELDHPTEEERVAALHARAEAAYIDLSFPPRQCDYCHKWYKGPAVYCGLVCALADA